LIVLVTFVLALVPTAFHSSPASAAYRYDFSAHGYDGSVTVARAEVSTAGHEAIPGVSDAARDSRYVYGPYADPVATNTADDFVIRRPGPGTPSIYDGLDEAVATSHGAERLREAGFDALSVENLRASPFVYEQADNAMVYVGQTADDDFDLVVIGERGVVTAHRGLTRYDLDGLAANFGWSGYP
jgi:hypothetical protein